MLRILVILFALALSVVSGLPPQSSPWEVRVLVPEHSPIPPTYNLHLRAGELVGYKINRNGVERFFDSIAHRLGLISAYSEVTSSCKLQMPMSDLANESISIATVFWQEFFPFSVLQKEKLLRRHFSPPLHFCDVVKNCSSFRPTPTWGVHTAEGLLMGENTIALLFNFTGDGTSETEEQCTLALELIRRVPLAESSNGKSSVSGPIVMLCAVIAMKFLPRYVLQKRGQIDRDSFTKRKPGQLSKAQRDHLLKRQEDIIAKMKAQDRENKDK